MNRKPLLDCLVLAAVALICYLAWQAGVSP